MVSFLMLAGCSDPEPPRTPRPSPERGTQTETELPRSDAASFLERLSPSEVDYVDALRESGHLKIATRLKEGSYERADGDRIGGFQYRLVAELAAMLRVPLDVTVVSFDDYFAGGPGHAAEGKLPRLPPGVDLYVDILTILPEREEVLSFARTIPVRQMIIARKGEEVSSFDDLRNRRISLQSASSYAQSVSALERTLGISLSLLIVPETSDMPVAVSNLQADATLQDSILCLDIIRRYPNLTVSLPIGEMQFVGWAVDKRNDMLAAIVGKFIVHAQESGVWERHWTDEYGISYIDYLKLIGL